jgi:hypothetical protein
MTIFDYQTEKFRREFHQLMTTSGWNTRVEHDIGDIATMIYVVDVETAFLATSGMSANATTSLRNVVETSVFTHEEICNAFGSLLADCAGSRATLSDEQRRHLGLLSALYLVRTKVYDVALKQRGSTGSFLVLRYPDVSCGEHVLRPVGLSSTSQPLTPAYIADTVQQVLAIDRMHHPSRFPTGQVIPFTPRPPVSC